MGLDPEALLAKRRSVVKEWLSFAQADALFEDWQAESAKAALERQLEG